MTTIHKLLKNIYELRTGVIENVRYCNGHLDLQDMKILYRVSLRTELPPLDGWTDFQPERMVRSPRVKRFFTLLDRLDGDYQLTIDVDCSNPSAVTFSVL